MPSSHHNDTLRAASPDTPVDMPSPDVPKTDVSVRDTPSPCMPSDVNDNVRALRDMNASRTRVQRFYSGKNVFITGATGFLGKLLVEKLLRSCPDVDTLYLLVRQKKGKDAYTRIDEIFDDPVFSVLKKQCPKFRHKVNIVTGDCALSGLALSLQDRHNLIEKIHVIFHAAATVKFDENLRTALAINVAAPLHIMDLAKKMKHLQSFMHVSTAYSNCHLDWIEEKVYDISLNSSKLRSIELQLANLQSTKVQSTDMESITYESLHKLVDQLDDEQIELILPTILGDWPNTYTYTKGLAEREVVRNRGDLPLSIFRPAVVTSSAKEPFPSWIDNLYGPTSIVIGAATGIVRTIHCDADVTADLVPVDYVVNCLIVASERCSRKHATPPIYNYVSSVENAITWGMFMTLILQYSFVYPLNSAVWYVSMRLNKYKWINNFYQLLFHILPALLLDGLRMCFGKRPKLLKVYRKIHKVSGVVSYFTTHDIRFSNERVQSLWEQTESDDRELFPFSISALNWPEYFSTYLLGIRTHIFHESDDTVKSARKRWARLYYLHQTFRILLYSFLIFVGWTMLQRVFF